MSFVAIIKCLRTQLGLLAIVMLFTVLAFIGVIPGPSELQSQLNSLFALYGVPVILVCSLFENIVGFNVYFPGSLVILTGMALSHGDPNRGLVTFLAIFVSATAAQFINYGIGGRFRQQATEVQSSRPTQIEFLLAFWHPHTASVVSIKAGTERLAILLFMRRVLVAGFVWNSFWGLAMYFSGGVAQSESGRISMMAVFLCYVVFWCVRDVRRENARIQRARTVK